MAIILKIRAMVVTLTRKRGATKAPPKACSGEALVTLPLPAGHDKRRTYAKQKRQGNQSSWLKESGEHKAERLRP
jgi:hypothetical protein